jgi:hypothetical protein
MARDDVREPPELGSRPDDVDLLRAAAGCVGIHARGDTLEAGGAAADVGAARSVHDELRHSHEGREFHGGIVTRDGPATVPPNPNLWMTAHGDAQGRSGQQTLLPADPPERLRPSGPDGRVWTEREGLRASERAGAGRGVGRGARGGVGAGDQRVADSRRNRKLA